MPAGAIPTANCLTSASGWRVLTASERGASHNAHNVPNQDAVAVAGVPAGGLIAAVADGHGHSRHIRSARGSRIAVDIACQAGLDLATRIAAGAGGAGDAARLADLARETTVPQIVRLWRAAVLKDVAADPFSDEESGQRHPGDDPTIAYGSTLLLAVAAGKILVLAQIGDGDIVGVLAGGAAILPVPADPQLDGMVTTSLCAANARSDFRVVALDVGQQPLVAVLLATDGYGNAQLAEPWAGAFSRDLVQMMASRDDQWFASQLPGWAAMCASAGGSADDTTVALLLTPDPEHQATVEREALRPPRQSGDR